ncbi:hypothetical protein L227DRAFT_608960 [Lentinus tigrinus ALCF2SS1-6]|uniref:Conidiation protein 6 n=1 Tax=Lentinus tigrinus ALCF2SS1-6 TaxID=1328759 RepID=A0A5C2SGV6_9APHY|nr:hypothetical protein L227DRAFT_608960 [Lentinus tigrinus ALCF2SS1-6]
MANPGNVARGLKAAVSNPNNSEETRADAQRRLDEMIDSGDATSTQAHNAQANINNPNTSEEAKERSRQAIEDLED